LYINYYGNEELLPERTFSPFCFMHQVMVFSFRPNMPRVPRGQKKDKEGKKKGKEIADEPV
jgi:hypothetical protein